MRPSFAAQRFLLIDIAPPVIERATALRAQYGFKATDALHLASAIVVGADVVLTGDRQLERCAEIPIEVVSS